MLVLWCRDVRRLSGDGRRVADLIHDHLRGCTYLEHTCRIQGGAIMNLQVHQGALMENPAEKKGHLGGIDLEVGVRGLETTENCGCYVEYLGEENDLRTAGVLTNFLLSQRQAYAKRTLRDERGI